MKPLHQNRMAVEIHWACIRKVDNHPDNENNNKKNSRADINPVKDG